MTSAPVVTVGLPTHNGERFLSVALESLVAQDYPSLEIVVFDNASTDGTARIVQEFRERDRRVRTVRSETLMNAPANFTLAFRETSGAYFMWAADDDLHDPAYVRRCLAALEAAPEAVMACSGLRFVDEQGAIVDADYGRYDNPDLSSPSVVERIRLLLRRGGWYEVYGLIRREALERTHVFADAYAPDVLLVLELAMLGPIVKVPEPLFFYRQVTGRTERDRVERQGGLEDVDNLMTAHLTHLQEAMSATVSAFPIPWPTRLRLRWEILWAVYVADTPIGKNARKELRARVAAARRRSDTRAYAKYGSLWLFDQRHALAGLPGRLIARVRRWAGRLRRRLLSRPT